MQFATFYKPSTGYIAGTIPPRFDPSHVKPIPALGSDGVALFDGRWGMSRCVTTARDICRKRGYIGFTIEAGERFTNSRIVRPLELITGATA